MINKELMKKTSALINYYDNINKALTKYKKQLSDLVLKEIENLSYAEAREYYMIIKDYITYEVGEKYRNLLNKKKEDAYPEILNVHYYPCIKDMNFLTKEQQILLDKFLMKRRCGTRINKYDILKALSSNKTIINYDNPIGDKIIDSLLDKGIVEKQYKFYCKCGDCTTVFSEEEKQKFFNYHNFDTKNCTDEEYEFHEMNYEDGFLFVTCMERDDCDIELSSIEDFEENLEGYIYKLIVEPDMTLDRL
ncbi:MAG: hypothetical protein ACLR02_10160 [Clostridium sp.]